MCDNFTPKIENLFFFTIFAPRIGEMQEWLNWPAWKASKRQKRFRGSNPLLSAKFYKADDFSKVICFCFVSDYFVQAQSSLTKHKRSSTYALFN